MNAGAPPRAPAPQSPEGLDMRARSAALRKNMERRNYEATAAAAALPAALPEKMQPPRNVPSRER
ncbi:hypothetical protein DER30_5532 [Streptomyces sp. HB202]|nr:hypothetical protein DER30_5532 [Streptomyces sp. HB202]